MLNRTTLLFCLVACAVAQQNGTHQLFNGTCPHSTADYGVPISPNFNEKMESGALPRCSFQDVNGDGLPDYMCSYDDQDGGLACATSFACH
jgi:hypothetical protein